MKRNIAAFVLLASLAATAAVPRAARAAESARGGTFLPLGWDARGAALGGAATVLITDERSAYWNPANLVFIGGPRVSFGTVTLVEGLPSRYSTFTAGAGFAEAALSPDSTYRWRRFAMALSGSHLGLELSEGSGWSESTFGVSAGYAITNYNAVGITVRVAKSWTDVEDADAWGAALDVGLTERVTRHLVFAVAGRNVLSQITYPERTETLDPSWNIALAYEDFFDRLSAECDVVLKDGSMTRFLAGAELVVARNLFFVSGGVDVRLSEGERAIPCFGLGTTFSMSEINLGFSFDPEDGFGRQTRISMGLVF